MRVLDAKSEQGGGEGDKEAHTGDGYEQVVPARGVVAPPDARAVEGVAEVGKNLPRVTGGSDGGIVQREVGRGRL